MYDVLRIANTKAIDSCGSLKGGANNKWHVCTHTETHVSSMYLFCLESHHVMVRCCEPCRLVVFTLPTANAQGHPQRCTLAPAVDRCFPFGFS
eukprot:3421568-Amphidinium_carterae.2